MQESGKCQEVKGEINEKKMPKKYVCRNEMRVTEAGADLMPE